MIRAFDKIWQIGERRFGFSHQVVRIDDEPYLERWILWLGIGTLRLHKFWRGDEDRAFHDHPFWFVTIPLNRGYLEKVRVFFGSEPLNLYHMIWVSRLRPSFRPATHQHIVTMNGAKPIWTFVITGVKTREWGFWPNADTFVHWREWERQQREEKDAYSRHIRESFANSQKKYLQKMFNRRFKRSLKRAKH